MSKYSVVGIGPPEIAAGLAAAGTPVVVVSPTDGVERLTTLLSRRDVGIVIADRRLVDALPESVRRQAARRATPVLLVVPRPDWTEGGAAATSEILDLLQRAIGYRVRLQ